MDVNELKGVLPGQAGPAQSAAPAHNPAPPAMTSHEDIRRMYLDKLISALGIEPEHYLRISGPAFGPAMAASEAFRQHQEANPPLRGEIRVRDEQARETLHTAYDRLRRQLLPNDTWNRQMLDDAWEEMDQNWAILMLLPNGPYELLFDQMVETYEPQNADGTLKANEAALLRSATALRKALQVNPRDTETAWLTLERALAEGADSDVVQLNGRRATH